MPRKQRLHKGWDRPQAPEDVARMLPAWSRARWVFLISAISAQLRFARTVKMTCLLVNGISHMNSPYPSISFITLVFQLPPYVSVHHMKVLLHLTQDRYNMIGWHATICNVLLDLERDFARMEVSLHYLSLCDCFFKSKVTLGWQWRTEHIVGCLAMLFIDIKSTLR